MAGSLVRAAGLPELATTSLAEYAEVALRLARDRDEHARLRARLAGSRFTCPLFDAEQSCRHLEAAFRAMWERHESGLPPAAFAVPKR